MNALMRGLIAALILAACGDTPQPAPAQSQPPADAFLALVKSDPSEAAAQLNELGAEFASRVPAPAFASIVSSVLSNSQDPGLASQFAVAGSRIYPERSDKFAIMAAGLQELSGHQARSDRPAPTLVSIGYGSDGCTFVYSDGTKEFVKR